MVSVDIDNVVYKMVESLEFDELIWLARKLDIEADPESWFKDEYIDQEQKVKEETEDVLRQIIETYKNGIEGKSLKLAEMILKHNKFECEKHISKNDYVKKEDIITIAQEIMDAMKKEE